MTTKSDPAINPDAKPVNLALQGGGAHGAFTWGVLDRFLEDKRIRLEAISGTSAGAMNGVVVADGLMRGGPEGARERLRLFWEEIGRTAAFSPIQRNPFDILMGNWSLAYSPAIFWLEAFTRSVSPYEFNPLDINPLRDTIEKLIDFDLVHSCEDFKLFISATNVENGRVKVFEGETLTADMVMASACLPTLFQAVEIDGQHYWDGGYMGNPVLFPFYDVSLSNDIVIVQINPVERKGVPRTAPDILNRIDEISFNSSLLSELRAVDFVRRMLEEDRLDAGLYRKLFIHIIDLYDETMSFGASSKYNAERSFLDYLFSKGRSAADSWLDANFDAIGKNSTVNIRQMFQGDGHGPADPDHA